MYQFFAKKKRTLQFDFQFPPVGNNFFAIFVNLAVKFLAFLSLLNLCQLRAFVTFFFLVKSFSIFCNFRYQRYCQSQANFKSPPSPCLSHFSTNIWGLFGTYSLLCSCRSVRNIHKRTDLLISCCASSLCETTVDCKLSIRMQRELSQSRGPFVFKIQKQRVLLLSEFYGISDFCWQATSFFAFPITLCLSFPLFSCIFLTRTYTLRRCDILVWYYLTNVFILKRWCLKFQKNSMGTMGD